MLVRRIISKQAANISKTPNCSLSVSSFNHQQRYQIGQKSIGDAYRKIMHLCKPQLPKYISNSIITLVHAGIFMYLPNIYTDINNLMAMTLETHTMEAINHAYLLMGGKWTAIFTLMGILTYQRRVKFLDISNRIGVRMRMVLFNQILTKQYYRKSDQTQALVHHIITDIKTVSDFTGQNVFFGLRGVLFLIGGSSCLIYTAPHLSLIALGIMALINLMFIGRLQKLRELKTTENSALRGISSFVGQRFQNLKLIKISNTQAFQQLRFFKETNQFYKLSYEVAKASGLNFGTLEAIGLMALFGVAISGSFLISTGVTSFSLMASSTYALYLALGFRSLMNFNTELVKIVAVYSNIEDKFGSIHLLPGYMDPKLMQDAHLIEEKIKALESRKVIQQSKGLSIVLNNIFFSHHQTKETKKSQWIYKDFTYEIQPGSVIAVIGPSGAGKSTLFNLITKLIDPQSGNIFFKNIDQGEQVNIKNFNFSEIQKMISYVTQQNYLFKGTFAQNLRYGNHGFDCSQERLHQCLKLTNAFNFVQQKGGINALVEQKGANLSGGQRQRIILARALVKHPRLLLMDEATAGIDSQSQKLIVKNLKQCRKQMTIMIITHKIQSFREILTDTLDLGDFMDEE